ncbi:MAG: glycosyltransferase [Planctomycetes bacterium]|nr:glycosyltransferase [Planctomycetota bacterium]
MTRNGESLPNGFLGPVKGWGSLVPAAQRGLQLPRIGTPWTEPLGQGPFELVELNAFPESFGRIEDALPRLAQSLVPGGTLLLDVDNIQSARMLRMVVEGRPGCFDPAGSTDDPGQALPLRRVLAATAPAGLLVRDVLAVPPAAEEFAKDLPRGLMANGLLPLEWLSGTPPTRFWLVCERAQPTDGSVVIAGGDVAARAKTRAALATFLPEGWAIVEEHALSECAQWNRGIAAARGEVIWLLRGGAVPTAELFAELSVHAGVGAVIAAPGGVRERAGDVAGLMLPRLDALLAGPLPEHIRNTPVALEEYAMRLDSRLPPPLLVDGRLECPPPAVEAPAQFAAETAELMTRWQALQPASMPAPAAAVEATTTAESPWSGREPRLSLCMIARNEERFLPECLGRVRDAVDEIIFVDTGSTDRTVAIAESFGAKVLHTTWSDDFAAPRNLGLAAATGDWILVLDADEFLQDGGTARLRELVRDPKVLGYHLHFVNVFDGGKTVGVMMVRLFRNLPGIAYENIIHEQVTPSLQRLGAPLGLVLTSSDLAVDHHGYRDEVMDARGKNERNERLFLKQLEQKPDDIYNTYKYGDFLRRVPHRGADARRLLDRCLELILAAPPSLPRGLPYAAEVAALCALEATRAGDTVRARQVIDVALRRFVPTPNLHYLAASLALAEQRNDDAIRHYRRCLAYRGQVLVVPIQEGITSYVSLAGIAQAWLQSGDGERARRLLLQAIAIHPAYEVAHLALSKLWLQRGDLGRALRVLTDFLAKHPESPGACQQTALILQRLGQTAAARRMGEHAVQMLEARALDHEAAQMQKILAAM